MVIFFILGLLREPPHLYICEWLRTTAWKGELFLRRWKTWHLDGALHQPTFSSASPLWASASCPILLTGWGVETPTQCSCWLLHEWITQWAGTDCIMLWPPEMAGWTRCPMSSQSVLISRSGLQFCVLSMHSCHKAGLSVIFCWWSSCHACLPSFSQCSFPFPPHMLICRTKTGGPSTHPLTHMEVKAHRAQSVNHSPILLSKMVANGRAGLPLAFFLIPYQDLNIHLFLTHGAYGIKISYWKMILIKQKTRKNLHCFGYIIWNKICRFYHWKKLNCVSSSKTPH